MARIHPSDAAALRTQQLSAEMFRARNPGSPQAPAGACGSALATGRPRRCILSFGGRLHKGRQPQRPPRTSAGVALCAAPRAAPPRAVSRRHARRARSLLHWGGAAACALCALCRPAARRGGRSAGDEQRCGPAIYRSAGRRPATHARGPVSAIRAAAAKRRTRSGRPERAQVCRNASRCSPVLPPREDRLRAAGPGDARRRRRAEGSEAPA